jgi:hypothetical protein
MFCSKCRNIKKGIVNFSFKINQIKPSTSPISGLRPIVTLIERRLIDVLKEERVRRWLHVGDVVNQQGIKLENWLAVFGDSPIIVRGKRECSYRTCEECGRIFYSAQGGRYIFPPRHEDGQIFQTDLCGLLVEEGTIDRDRLPKSRWLGVEVLKADPNPRDGFGDLEQQVASGALPRAFPERVPSRWELGLPVED